MNPRGAVGGLLRVLGRREPHPPPPVPPHTFQEKSFRKRSRSCAVCQDSVGAHGLLCRVCKIVSHKRCEAKVTSPCHPPPPPELRRNTAPPRHGEKPDRSLPSSVPWQHRSLPRLPPPAVPSAPPAELSYVTERMIAVRFPVGTDERRFHGDLRDVALLLRARHRDGYTLFNLSEKRHDLIHLHPTVQEFGWPDLLAPPLDTLCAICKALERCLRALPPRVAVLHCRGNRGKVGVVVAAYMHYSRICASAEQALGTATMKQFCEERVGGDMLPSQRRYIAHFGALLSGATRVNSRPVFLHHVLLPPLPRFQPDFRPFLKLYQALQLVHTSGVYAPGPQSVCISLEPALLLKGDVLVQCYQRWGSARRAVFRAQFHTCALQGERLRLCKEELDLACEDERFPPDAAVEFVFSSSPDKVEGWASPCGTVCVDLCTWDPTVRRDSFHGFNVRHQDSSDDLTQKGGPQEESPHTLVQDKGAPGDTPWKEESSTAAPPPLQSSPGHPPPPTAAERWELEQLLGGCGLGGGQEESPPGAPHRTPVPYISPAAHGDPVPHSTLAPHSDAVPHSGPALHSSPVSHSTTASYSTTAPHNCPVPHEDPVPHSTAASYSTLVPHGNVVLHGDPMPYSCPLHHSTAAPYSTVPPHRDPVPHSCFESYSALPPHGDAVPHSTAAPCCSLMPHSTPTPYSDSVPCSATPPHRSPTVYSAPTTPHSPPTSCTPPASYSPPSPYSPSHPYSTLTPYSTPMTYSPTASYSPPSPHSPLTPYSPTASYSPPTPYRPTVPYDTLAPHSTQSAHRTHVPLHSTPSTHSSASAPHSAHVPHSAYNSPPMTPCSPSHHSSALTPHSAPMPHGTQTSMAPHAHAHLGHALQRRPSLAPPPPCPCPGGGVEDGGRRRARRSLSEGAGSVLVTPLCPLCEPRPFPVGPPLPKSGTPGSPGESAGEPGSPQDSPTQDHPQGESSPSPSFPSPSSYCAPPVSGPPREERSTPGGGTTPPRPPPAAADPPAFAQDTSRFWYKPGMSREQAVALLKDREPGAFLVRDSTSFRGGYGLALRVAQPPPGCPPAGKGDPRECLVRHFLIETGPRGVKIRGGAEEPHFGSLPALVLQHSIQPMSLPCALRIPCTDLLQEVGGTGVPNISTAAELLRQGAGCSVRYLGSVRTEALTGPRAVAMAADAVLGAPPPPQCTAHFHVSARGITLTDRQRRLFFRRHYPVGSVTFCSTDPEDRRWVNADGTTSTIFGFVAKQAGGAGGNTCHLFAELDPEQPARAIVSFVTKVMLRRPPPERPLHGTAP
ncbi:tensin-2 [Cyrtonyx montezumae]|uniref:tensin-2 n=1 Tax=Cyrtonyx montezumae TaxID=9017 RepID=UPI0032DB0A73